MAECKINTYNKNEKGKNKGDMKLQLSIKENTKFVPMKTEIDWSKLLMPEKEWPHLFQPIFDLSHAYGV